MLRRVSLALLLLVPAVAWAEPVTITASSLNVRSTPGGPVLGQVRNGQKFVVRARSGSWVRIDYAGRTAWVFARYTQGATASEFEVTASRLNVRRGPSTQQSRIGQVSKGQRYVVLESRGDWHKIQFDGRSGWAHGRYLESKGDSVGLAGRLNGDSSGSRDSAAAADAGGRVTPAVTAGDTTSGGDSTSGSGAASSGDASAGDSVSGTGNAPFSIPEPDESAAGGGAPSRGSSLASVHAGLTYMGAQIPRAGLYNHVLRRGEPYGARTSHEGLPFVRGKVSWFGGPRDTGVTSTETGAITLERLRSLNNPLNPAASTLRSRPEAYYFVAMRWAYRPRGKSFWRHTKLLLVNPRTGAAVVVRPVDWGPHTRTRRILDLSPQALKDLGLRTDDEALVAFAEPGTRLGPLR